MKRLISMVLVLTVICGSLVFATVSVNAENSADSIVAIAEGELGNTNYRKYSSYSNAWCADFVSWCARQAGVDSIPSTASCYSMYNGMIANGCQEVLSPQRGDIVFFFCNSCSGTANIWCHVGIMVNSSTSIDGNYKGKVYYDNSYSHYGSLGYKHSGGIRKIYVRPNYSNPNPPKSFDPFGYIDSISGGVGSISLAGWALDQDDFNAQLNIHVYIGGPSGDSNAEGHNQIWANKRRTDVNNIYQCGDYHGFEDIIYTSKTGIQPVYIYAINIGGGDNRIIGEATVNISADTESPIVENSYFDQVKKDSFWPCFTIKDNVGIKNVKVATWTQGDQSDIIWHQATNNGYGTYFVEINRSDYSNTNNSIYHNHAYIYDYVGNCTFAAIDMDYRIKSDTGKNLPEGEYRIATAVNNNRFIDVAEGSTTSGANIQIKSNSHDKKQTFDLIYSGNGFYKIKNSNSNRLLDVDGDTYLNNTNVIQCVDNGGANQEWMIKPTGDNDGYYYIISRANGLALDLTYALDQDGANIAVHDQNQTIAQKWKLRRVLNDSMISVNDFTINSNTDEIIPEITVKVDNEIIPQNGNYQVEITTDIEKGKGTVTVTGIDKYCDSVTKEFNISKELIILGDADGNGDVDISDATIIQRYLSSAAVPYPEETLMNADVDGDSELTILDATFIQRHIAKINVPYPIGKPKT